MEPKEFDIFSRLEHEMGRDLSEWRHDIIAKFEACCRAAFEIEESRVDEPLNLTDPAINHAIRRQVIDFLAAGWIDLEASPQQGDFISMTGEIFWHTIDSNDGELITFKLPTGHKIQGIMAHWDILPYLDEKGLEVDAHRNLELVRKYFRPFGVHLVIDNPTLTNEVGTLMPLHPERAYLPVHYEQVSLKLYTAR